MSKLKIGISPLTNEIYIGSVSKDGMYWLNNKTDVTNDAICCVANHILRFQKDTGKNVVLKGEGVPDMKITVELLEQSE